MLTLFRHVLVPAVVPALFFIVALMPVHLLGSHTRGLLTVLIALASVLAGLGATITAVRARQRKDPLRHWWMASAAILAIPAVAVVVLA